MERKFGKDVDQERKKIQLKWDYKTRRYIRIDDGKDDTIIVDNKNNSHKPKEDK